MNMRHVMYASAALILVLLGEGKARTTTVVVRPAPGPPPVPKPPALPPTAAAKPGEARKWMQEAGPTVRLLQARQYAARIDVRGIDAMFAGASDVQKKLQRYAKWRALQVWESAEQVPAELPFAERTKVTGRFWALGSPAADMTILRYDPIAELWSRSA
jgi:hypothetical protein